MEVATVPGPKSVFRRKFKDVRRQFAQNGGALAASELKQNLNRLLQDFSGVQRGLYRALPDEAPCLVDAPQDFFYPVICGTDLEFRQPRDRTAFHRNHLSIEEPVPGKSTLLDLALPAVIFCPALAVDGQGNRLGMGQGFYDRFFAKHPDILRVGVVFHVQFSADPLPAESWDQAMDWIVSEKMILRTSPLSRSPQSWI